MYDVNYVGEFTKAIGVARRSTDEKKQEHSIESQRETIEEVCAEHNIFLQREFGNGGIIERDGSGLAIENAELNRAIEFCLDNDVKQIVFTEVSRFSREEPLQAATRLIGLRDAGIDLIFISRFPRRFDITDEQDRDDIVGEIRRSHEKSKEQAEIVTSRMIARAKRRYMPPASVFGVSVCRNKEEDKNKWWLEVDQEKLAVVREAGLAVLDGKSSSDVVALFDGYLTNGKRKDREAIPFRWIAVKRLLTNPIFAGDYVMFKQKAGKLRAVGKGYMIQKYDSVRVKGESRIYSQRTEYQPLENQTIVRCEEQDQEEEFNTTVKAKVFSRGEWDDLQEHFQSRKRTTNRKRIRRHLLTGFL